MNAFTRFFADRAIRKELTMIPKGYLTKIGAVGVVLATLAALCNDVATGAVTMEKLTGYGTVLSGAVVALGLRRAIGRVEGGAQ